MIRAMNEQFVLSHLRRAGELSRAELTRLTGLSKPTISLTVTNLERRGMVRASGLRTGTPGPAAALYKVRPEAGYVMGLDVGSQFLRGAVCDLSGNRLSRLEIAVEATTGEGRVRELSGLAAKLRAEAGIGAAQLTQTVLGTPGVYDPRRDTLTLTGAHPDWEKPELLARLRSTLSASLMVENDIDAAAMAEREYGHGRDSDSFAFVSIGTGIGLGLVLDGQLRRGCAWRSRRDRVPAHRARRGTRRRRIRGADGAVRGRRSCSRNRASGPAGRTRRADTARAVFDAAAAGDARASAVVADEADLIARGIASIIAVVDPHLVVLGGGIGQAEGLLQQVERALPRFAPVMPQLRVSALGRDAVVDGCLSRARPGMGDSRSRSAERSRGRERCRQVSAPAPYVLAADGGNSKTELVLATLDGTVLTRQLLAGTRPHLDGGIEAMASALAAGARQARATVGLQSVRPVHGVFCLANVDLPEDEVDTQIALVSRGVADTLVVQNDTFAVLSAGTDRGWGVAVIAGAGINALGVHPDGRVHRFLALGDFTGDWGGGYSSGVGALGAAIRAGDGRGDRTILTELVPRAFDRPDRAASRSPFIAANSPTRPARGRARSAGGGDDGRPSSHRARAAIGR